MVALEALGFNIMEQTNDKGCNSWVQPWLLAAKNLNRQLKNSMISIRYQSDNFDQLIISVEGSDFLYVSEESLSNFEAINQVEIIRDELISHWTFMVEDLRTIKGLDLSGLSILSNLSRPCTVELI